MTARQEPPSRKQRAISDLNPRSAPPARLRLGVADRSKRGLRALPAPPPRPMRRLHFGRRPNHRHRDSVGRRRAGPDRWNCSRTGKRGQHDQALGRSRGGFSTKIHLKTDFGGLPIAFHLTGGEASDSRNFETLLDIGPDLNPRAALGDKGHDSKSNRDAARQRGICPAIPYRSNTRICPPSSENTTRHGHASNKRSASSNASSVSHFDARRRRRITARSSRLLSASS